MTGIRELADGVVSIRLSGDTEAGLRALADAGAVVRRISKVGGDVRFDISLGDFRLVRRACALAGCRFHIVRKRGLPFVLRAIRRRPVLLAGAILVILASCALSGFIWSVTVTGADAEDAARITEALASLGIAPGTPSDAFDAEQTRMALTRLIPDCSYAAVNIRGSRAYVQVVGRREVPSAKYEREISPADVTAAKSGIITRVDCFMGDCKVNPGMTVDTGDLLVSGEVDILTPNMKEKTGRTRLVHARADVWARVWRVTEARLPAETLVKRYTGRTKTVKTYFFAGHVINFWETTGIYYAHCDRITEESVFTLPFGAETPISTVTETYREYELVPEQTDTESAEKYLRSLLTDSILRNSDRGRLVSAVFTTAKSAVAVTITLKSETQEQIGLTHTVR